MITMRIKIRDLNQYGQGVGATEDGLVVFVEGALPGELVDAGSLEPKKNYSVATSPDIIEFAPQRVDPSCPYYPKCGGCQLQHLSYEGQLTWKQQNIKEQLDRIGNLEISELISPIIAADLVWHYRNKAILPVGGTYESTQIGFFHQLSHEIVDGTHCLIQHPAEVLIRAFIRSFIRSEGIQPYNNEEHKGLLRNYVVRTSEATGEVSLTLILNTGKGKGEGFADLWRQDLLNLEHTLAENGYTLTGVALNFNPRRGNVILGRESIILIGNPRITDIINQKTHVLSPESFFQVNSAQAAKLYSVVRNYVAESKAAFDDDRNLTILDIYCGVGSIAIQLADLANNVIGIEVNEKAVADAKVNARINNCHNCRFIAAKAENWIQNELDSNIKIAVVDPPRRGLDSKLIKALNEADHLKSLIYVSCNPATLARDLAFLSSSWKILKIQPLDLFPHTTHVETVVLMERLEIL